ncbi:MAG: hypothetical protein P0120_07460 [Nitrospira sp.]|nr:hypothetical protein [Nitrospira sp.]
MQKVRKQQFQSAQSALRATNSASRLICSCFVISFALTCILSQDVTRADLQSEVTVWHESGMAVATSPLSGRREIPLGAQEVVISSGTNGINGIVVTSRRLLGFSSRALTWAKKELDVNEKVLERKILPTFSLIRTDRHLYGFRGANGLWLEEALGVREKVTRFHSNDYGVVFITNERLIGFTPLLGGFASKPLDVHERIVGVDNENGLILVSTTRRTLVFGSRLSGWEEFE